MDVRRRRGLAGAFFTGAVLPGVLVPVGLLARLATIQALRWLIPRLCTAGWHVWPALAFVLGLALDATKAFGLRPRPA